MKKVKLEILSHNGELIKHEQISISEGDRIVLQATEKIPYDQLLEVHNSTKKALVDDNSVITLGNTIKFSVVKIN